MPVLEPGFPEDLSMYDKNCSNDDCSNAKPDYVATERNRFFTGKFMTARDFRADPEYFLSRHRLQNRLLFGWGIICGLEVSHHTNPLCEDRWVVVSRGMALDCFGREIVVSEEVRYKLVFPGDPDYAEGVGFEGNCGTHRSSAETRQQCPKTQAQDSDFGYLLCVRFCERCVEKVPALYSNNTCDPQREEFNRIRECPEFRQIPISCFGSDCWHAPSVFCRQNEKPRTGCDPLCPCREWVPLALVRKGADKVQIETNGRRELYLPGQDLTRIIEINWSHGGSYNGATNNPIYVPTGSGSDEKVPQLRIRFSRPLHVASENSDRCAYDSSSGINEATFTLWYSRVSDTTPDLKQYQPWHYEEGGYPHVDKNDPCVAVYPLPKKHFWSDLQGCMISIRLLGDFIRDCHQNPPDVNFVRSKLPTGNGAAGGTFYSWLKFE